MEKLIELLNEFEKVREKSEYQKLSNKEYKWFSSYFFPLCFGHQENFSGAMTNEFGEGTENVICSKQYGFIKWLVENDKIDTEFEDNKMLGDIFDSGYRFNDDYMEERLLCYLALSNTPIEFLISILKNV